MKLIHLFNQRQLEWLKNENIVINNDEYSDDEIINMIEKLEDLLQEKGIKNDMENEYGTMCVDILNILGNT